MSPADRKEYNAYRNESLKERDYIVSAEEKGIEIGKAEGKAKGKAERNIEIAKNLLSQNIDINTISTSTGLSIADIQKLKS